MSVLDPDICRICLTPKSAFINAFGCFHTKSLPLMLKELFKLKMNQDTCLPQHICEACLIVIIKAEALKHLAIKNEKFLIDLASVHKSQKSPLLRNPKKVFHAVIAEEVLDEVIEEEMERPITPIDDPVMSAESELEDIEWQPYMEINESVKEVKRKEERAKNLFYCSYCFKEFNTRVKCVNHERSKHEPKPKNEPRPFICDRCGLDFKQKGHVQNHLRVVHLKVRNYQCNVCGFAMYSKTHHESHMAGHLDVRNFKCILCEKAFTREKALKAHLQTHTDARPYKCKYCNKTYTAHSDLKRHIFHHTRIHPYTCKLCSDGFHLKRLLFDHVLVYHPGIDTSSWLTGKTIHNFTKNL